MQKLDDSGWVRIEVCRDPEHVKHDPTIAGMDHEASDR